MPHLVNCGGVLLSSDDLLENLKTNSKKCCDIFENLTISRWNFFLHFQKQIKLKCSINVDRHFFSSKDGNVTRWKGIFSLSSKLFRLLWVKLNLCANLFDIFTRLSGKNCCSIGWAQIGCEGKFIDRKIPYNN